MGAPLAPSRGRRHACARIAAGAAALVAHTSPLCAASSAATRFTFALIGDTPYSVREERDLAAILRRWPASLAFAIHLGDLKSGIERCDDEMLAHRVAMLAASPVPLVSVPGDNDWLDCSRASAGAFDPGERLERLRALAHRGPDTLGARTMRVERQRDARATPGLAENQRWRYGDTLFFTLNLPGGWARFARDTAHASLRAAIEQANARWMRESFAIATSQRLPQVAIAVHANPGFEHDPGAAWTWRPLRSDGYRPFRDALREALARYPGDVLLMHGDTHYFRDDAPLVDARGAPIDRFTRVECFGSPFSSAWIEITVQPREPGDGGRGERSPFFVAIRRLEDPQAR